MFLSSFLISPDGLKPARELLPAIALIMGLVSLSLSVPALASPAKAASLCRAFPRSAWTGRVLAAIALVWCALWLSAMPLGPLMALGRYLHILTPLAIVAVSLWLDELLACRALGGLLALVATPMLSAAQWHHSPLRFAIIILAYLLAIAGMFLLALPYLGRDALFSMAERPRLMRGVAIAGTISGALLLGMALILR